MSRGMVFLMALLGTLPAQAQPQIWNFSVLLDGKPIGTHRFEVTTQGERRTVLSHAEFAVKLLGLTVYDYRHHAREHWQDNCLRGLESTTRDGGKSLRVALDAARLPPCVMSYAYWNPDLLQQTRLVNAQTGNLDAVKVSALGMDHIEVRGESVAASRWRITGLAAPIDLWYAPAPEPTSVVGEWLGLDSRPGGRLLSYRLR